VILAPELTTINVPGSLITQILNVLMDNALRRGRGAVTLTVREISEALALDVTDEGSITMESASVFERGMSGGNGQGIGLALARSMAEASGGRAGAGRQVSDDLHVVHPRRHSQGGAAHRAGCPLTCIGMDPLQRHGRRIAG